MHLGRKYYSLVLCAPTPVLHKRWLDLIVKQQQAMRDRSMVFDTVTLSEGFFHGPNKVNCAAPFSKVFSFRIMLRSDWPPLFFFHFIF